VKAILAVVALVVLASAPLTLYFLSSSPVVDVTPKPAAVAAQNTLNLKVTSPHGVRQISARLEQGQARSSASHEEPADRWMFWKKKLAPAVYSLNLTAKPDQGFKSGPAKLIIEATANDLAGGTDSKSFDVIVNLQPPRLSVDGAQHYINQGGAELVTFTLTGYATESGVKVGNYKFRSFPVPGAPEGQRFCLFAFPWDVPADAVPLVYATNPAGQEVTGRFWFKLFPKKFRQRELDLSDAFLEKAVNDIEPGGAGEKLQRFLHINREVRRQNNQTLADLRNQTEARFLWDPPFQQLSNSKVEAFFADVRTYKYEGKKVDEQVHLGFDLSKVKEAPVVASNTGKVVYADRLGIYGNCVVLDHGFGLQSIYAHMSHIGVKKGQTVQRGGELGRSGSTGLAGGDHLHFSMQIDGVQVNPVEWWDPHWIKDRILSKMTPGGAPAATAAPPDPDAGPKSVSHAPRKGRRKR
jgi:murein DD-endopeptidase MepM/ murein hydrolase activator NlpD